MALLDVKHQKKETVYCSWIHFEAQEIANALVVLWEEISYHCSTCDAFKVETLTEASGKPQYHADGHRCSPHTCSKKKQKIRRGRGELPLPFGKFWFELLIWKLVQFDCDRHLALHKLRVQGLLPSLAILSPTRRRDPQPGAFSVSWQQVELLPTVLLRGPLAHRQNSSNSPRFYSFSTPPSSTLHILSPYPRQLQQHFFFVTLLLHASIGCGGLGHALTWSFPSHSSANSIKLQSLSVTLRSLERCGIELQSISLSDFIARINSTAKMSANNDVVRIDSATPTHGKLTANGQTIKRSAEHTA